MVLPSGPSGAQGIPTMTAAPTTVRDGDRITVSGTGCLDDQGSADGLAAVAQVPLGYPNSNNPQGLSIASTTPAADGTWTLELFVETREEFFGPYEDREATLSAACVEGLSSSAVVLFEYPEIVISYDGTRDDEPETTTTVTAPPTATVAPPAPAPAAPVRGAAAYTG
jgi:hypothetical protein